MRRSLSLIVLILFVSVGHAVTKTVAISYFDNNSKDPEYAPLSKGIADMMITELSDADAIRVVEREKLEKLLKEIELNKSEYIDPETAQKLGKGLGAEAILTGAFLVKGDRMRIDARLIEVQTAEVLLTEKVSGKKDAFFELHERLSRKLLEALNSASEPDLSEKNEGVSFRSVVNYSKALEQKDHGLPEKAKRTLQRTLERDPSFKTASSRLDSVEVWLKKLERKRARLLKKDLQKTLKELDPDSEQLGRDLNRIWTRLLSSMKYNELLEFNRMLREKGVEADQKLYQGSDRTFGQQAVYYDLTALYNLKRYEAYLPKARTYLEKHPSSPQFRAIKTQVRQAAKELEKREKGWEKAEERIAELDTSALSRKELLKKHATIYHEEHQYPEEIAVRWRLIENLELKEDRAALQHFLLAQSYQELGAFDECRRIGKVMERKFPESEYTSSLGQMIPHLPK
jgi:TolB-like protein